MSQTPHSTLPSTNQPMQYGQPPSFEKNNHTEITKVIQKVLQPRVKQYSLWNLPSRDYMSKAMKCQMCEVTVNEVETLLICDACERAYHLKCLQINNVKGVPKSDWYCSRCVQAFNGKPFPPKCGRAITKTTAKVPAGVQSSMPKKVGSMDIKVNQQQPIVTTAPGVQIFSSTSHFEYASVNANTTTSIAKITNIEQQGLRESLIRCTNAPASVLLTKTPKPEAIASTSPVMNNGLLSKPLTLVGTMSSSTSPSPVGNRVHVNATSNAILSTPISASLVAEAPTVTENGDNSSTASGTASYSILNSKLTTKVRGLTVTCGSNSQLEMSHSENAKAIEGAAIGETLNANEEPQAPMKNLSRCENPSPVGNRVPVDATSNAILSTPISYSLVAEAPTVTENGDNSSSAFGITGHFVLNTNLTTEVQALTVTSGSNSQPEMSRSENAKAIEDAAIDEALNVNDGPQFPMENVARCENTSESSSHSDSLNAITTPNNGQDASKDGSVSETCQNYPTESLAGTVISDKDSKIIAESSMPQENSADQTEKTASQPPSVSSNYHS